MFCSSLSFFFDQISLVWTSFFLFYSEFSLRAIHFPYLWISHTTKICAWWCFDIHLIRCFKFIQNVLFTRSLLREYVMLSFPFWIPFVSVLSFNGSIYLMHLLGIRKIVPLYYYFFKSAVNGFKAGFKPKATYFYIHFCAKMNIISRCSYSKTVKSKSFSFFGKSKNFISGCDVGGTGKNSFYDTTIEKNKKTFNSKSLW